MGHKKHLLVTLLFFISFFSIAQEKLIVFKCNGEEVTYKNKDAFIGMIITKEGKINLGKQSNITLVDEAGNLYKLDKTGNYNLLQVFSKKQQQSSESVSKKYLKYVYNKFMDIGEKEVVYGGVQRGIILMSSPNKYAYSTTEKWTNFNWKNPGVKTFYVTIRNFKSKKVIEKFKVSGTSLGVQLNKRLYKEKCIYQWNVSIKEFPDLEKEAFYNIKMVDEEEYKKIEKDTDYQHKKMVDLIIETKE